MIKEAIILAGGLGTRLRSAVPELPKCMAPVLAKPFIGYVMDYLQQQGIKTFILSLGYKHQLIEQYLNTQYGNLHLIYSVEEHPLGTGGAIQAACRQAVHDTVLVLNGDTFFKADVAALSEFHQAHNSECTLALKPMTDFYRYGAVALDENAAIETFKEKKQYADGLINAGVYALQVAAFLHHAWPERFSFEKDYLEKQAGAGKIYGCIQDAYFIDIGIPEDYEKAQTELILNL